MSNLFEKTMSDCAANEKKENAAAGEKSKSDFPSDAVSVARQLDNTLDSLKHDYEKLKDRIRKDFALTKEIEDLMKKATDRIIKPY